MQLRRMSDEHVFACRGLYLRRVVFRSYSHVPKYNCLHYIPCASENASALITACGLFLKDRIVRKCVIMHACVLWPPTSRDAHIKETLFFTLS